jgi:hypothetical protein
LTIHINCVVLKFAVYKYSIWHNNAKLLNNNTCNYCLLTLLLGVILTDVVLNVLSSPSAHNLRMSMFRQSVSSIAIRKAVSPVSVLVGGSVFMLALTAQLSTFALATDYTTTQTESLQDGDTITTTETGTGGYGLWSKSTQQISAPSGNIIKVSGDSAYGLVAFQPWYNSTGTSTIVATGAQITATGKNGGGVRLDTSANAYAIGELYNVTIHVDDPSSVGISASERTTLTTDGQTVITAAGTGIDASGKVTITGTHVTSTGDGGKAIFFGSPSSTSVEQVIEGNAVIRAQGNTTATALSAGVWSTYSQTLAPLIDDGVSVETFGKTSFGAGANANKLGLQVKAATVVTHGDNADGVRAQYQSTTTLNGTHVTTHGASAAGAEVGNAPFGAGDFNNTITITGADLTTTGDGSHAVQIYGDNDITMDAATPLSTSGVGSHGISIQGGASKTYDKGTKLARTISVTGKDSAAFHSTGAATNLVITNAPTITLGKESGQLWLRMAGPSRRQILLLVSLASGRGVRAQVHSVQFI